MKQCLSHYDEMPHLHNGTVVELDPQTTPPRIGDPITSELNPQPPSCANCSAEIPEGASICDNCGMPLPGATPPQQQASPQQEVPTQPPPEPSPTPPPQRASIPPAAHRDDQPRWRRHRVPVLTLLLLLLVLLFAGTAYALTRTTSEDVTVVPDLVGASSVEEAQKIAGENFEVVEGEGVESREPIGTIVEQDPAAGEMADRGSTISVYPSKGANLRNVRGQTREEAVGILRGAGFEVEERTEESSAANEGYVTEQDPRGGKREFAEAGSTVTITVGEGPAKRTPESSAPPEQAPVPPPADKNVEAPKQVPEKAKDTAPKQIAIPDVVGKKIEEAKQTIQNTGFDYTVETVQSNQPSGTVVSTDPDLVDNKVEETEPPPPPPDTKADKTEPKFPPTSGTKDKGTKPESPSPPSSGS